MLSSMGFSLSFIMVSGSLLGWSPQPACLSADTSQVFIPTGGFWTLYATLFPTRTRKELLPCVETVESLSVEHESPAPDTEVMRHGQKPVSRDDWREAVLSGVSPKR